MGPRGTQRAALYFSALVATGLLVNAGWIHQPGADAATLVSCAEAEMQMGLFQSAHDKAANALAMEPRNLHGLLVDAHCRGQLNDPDGAADQYRRALAICEPGSDLAAEVRVALALDAMRRKAPAEALQILEPVHTVSVPDARVKVAYVRGLAQEAAGDRAAALRSFALAAAETSGRELDLSLDAAQRMFALGSRDEAIAALENLSIRLADKSLAARAVYLAAKLKFEAGRDDSALEDLGRLRDLPRARLAGDLASDRDFWQVRIQRGEIPSEVGNLVLFSPRGRATPMSGPQDPTQQQSMGAGHPVPESKRRESR